MEVVTMILILSVVVPIFLGYVALIMWPIGAMIYIGVVFVLQEIFQHNKNSKIEQSEILGDTWNHLYRLNKIPWDKMENALELSSKTKKIGDLLKKLGVHEVDNLRYGKISEYSMSFPDQYDLVTNILNENISPNLVNLYKNASGFLRQGGLFISIERLQKIHSLNDHVQAAKKSGLQLKERSDCGSKNAKVSIEKWVSAISELRGTMLVWQKV